MRNQTHRSILILDNNNNNFYYCYYNKIINSSLIYLFINVRVFIKYNKKKTIIFITFTSTIRSNIYNTT